MDRPIATEGTRGARLGALTRLRNTARRSDRQRCAALALARAAGYAGSERRAIPAAITAAIPGVMTGMTYGEA